LTSRAPISVVAAYYDDPRKAHDTLKILERLRNKGAIEIVDFAIMTRPNGSDCLQIAETAELAARKAASSGAAGSGIIAAIFPPSILALGSVGAAAGAAFSHFSDQGFDDNILKEIGENLPPGGAALVAVVEEKWLAELSETLADYAALERFAMRPDVTMRPDTSRF
jgi:uncharacterized membrane protein